MLMNRNNDIVRLFGDLRYVVLDEIHTLTGTDRGNQIICQLCRISRLIGRDPRQQSGLVRHDRRHGSLAAKWLGCRLANAGGYSVARNEGDPHVMAARNGAFLHPERLPRTRSESGNKYAHRRRRSHRPAKMNLPDPKRSDNSVGYTPGLDPGFEYIYDCTADKKSPCFLPIPARRRSTCTATLRQIARRSAPNRTCS